MKWNILIVANLTCINNKMLHNMKKVGIDKDASLLKPIDQFVEYSVTYLYGQYAYSYTYDTYF
jgi:hypothetical protein